MTRAHRGRNAPGRGRAATTRNHDPSASNSPAINELDKDACPRTTLADEIAGIFNPSRLLVTGSRPGRHRLCRDCPDFIRSICGEEIVFVTWNFLLGI